MKSPSKYDEARAAREARYEASQKPAEPAAVAEAPKPVVSEPKPVKAAPAAPKRSQMYAPPGQCECCDRNRAKALDRVKRHREKRK